MPEYIVDCEHVPYGDDLMLVLPISINGHVHERIIRCRDCYWCTEYDKPAIFKGHCRAWRAQMHELDGFCHRAQPKARSSDGNAT